MGILEWDPPQWQRAWERFEGHSGHPRNVCCPCILAPSASLKTLLPLNELLKCTTAGEVAWLQHFRPVQQIGPQAKSAKPFASNFRHNKLWAPGNTLKLLFDNVIHMAHKTAALVPQRSGCGGQGFCPCLLLYLPEAVMSATARVLVAVATSTPILLFAHPQFDFPSVCFAFVPLCHCSSHS